MNRIITVKGTGNLSVKPDLIIITMNLQSHEYDYQDTMILATESINTIQKAVQGVGFDKSDLKTTGFDVNTNYESYRDEKNNHKTRFDGYICEQQLKLEFDFNTETMAEVITAVVKTSVGPQLNIRFGIRDKSAISEELLINATENARKKAEILTKASNVSLGNLINIDYNWGELHLYSPTRYNIENNMMLQRRSSPNIQPDNIDLTDTASFVWEIN